MAVVYGFRNHVGFIKTEFPTMNWEVLINIEQFMFVWTFCTLVQPNLSNLCVFVLYVGIYFDVQEITPYAVGVYRFDASDQPVSGGHLIYACLLSRVFTRYITNIKYIDIWPVA